MTLFRGDTSLAYDSWGRIQSAADFEGYSIAYSYDALDRITNVAFPDGTSITTLYDKLDPVAIKGRDNRWTYQTFSAPGQLTDVQDPSGNITHYEWCSCGSLESITDPKGQMTLWTRDSQSRVTSKFYPDFSQTAYSYESKISRLKEVLDAAGKKASFLYNTDNTLKSLSFSGGPATPSVTNTYDTNYSRLTKIVDGTGTTTIGYVTNGLPGAGNVQTVDGPLANDTISFTYDSLGRVQTTQVGTNVIGVLRDDLGRIYSVSNLLGTTTVEYVGDSSRPSRLTKPAGFITEFTYSEVSDGFRVTNITHTGSSVLILSFGYQYDSLGRIITMTETTTNSAKEWSYEYDLAGRLAVATQRDGAGAVLHRYVYGYDKAGNRISEQVDTAVATETVNVANQITSHTGGGIVRVGGYLNETGTVTIAGSPARMLTTTNFVGEVSASVGTNWFDVVATDPSGNKTTNWYQVPITANGLDTVLTYDAAGNTLSKSNAAGVMTFGWDSADRCTAITNGNYRTTLAYDGNSRWARITEYSNATVLADRRFIWNGVTLAEERDASNNMVQRFFSDGFQRGGTNYFYVKDHLGSVREVYSQSGVLQARFNYDPYGNKTQTYGTLKVDFGFAGLFELPNGIKLAVWRIYDPVTGRWGSKDPIREDGGLNLYGYCGGDPVNRSDYLGLWSKEVVEAIIANSVGSGWILDDLSGVAVYSATDIRQERYKVLSFLARWWYGRSTQPLDPLPLNGASFQAKKEIWIDETLSDLEAATYLVHELRHQHQNLVQLQTGKVLTQKQREYDAWSFTEAWLLANHCDPSAPQFRNSDKTLNIQAIRAAVDRAYGFGDKTLRLGNVIPPKNLKRVF